MLVFVYGTLLKGNPNHQFLRHSRFVDDATMLGATMFVTHGAFPYVALTNDAATIVGEIWDVDANTLAHLDRLEGVPMHYRRVMRSCVGASGKEYAVNVYVVAAQAIKNATIVEGGSWRHWRESEVL